MKINSEALAQLNELARRERELHQEINAWSEEHLAPLLDQCASVEEVDEIYAQIVIKDEESQIQDLPGVMGVDKCFAYSKFWKEGGEHD